MGVNIPNALPLVYELDQDMKPIGSHYLVTPQEFQLKAQQLKAEMAKNASFSL